MFIIYSKPNCTYCVQAKTLLKMKGFSFIEIDLTENDNLSQFRERLPNAKTVPQIYHNETYVGGYTELVPYLTSIWPTG